MYDCGITVLQNMVCSSNTFVVLCHRIPRSTNHHTIAMVEKANCNEESLESVSLLIMIIMAVDLKLI